MDKMRIIAANNGLLDGRSCTTVELDWEGTAPEADDLAAEIAAAARRTKLPHPVGGECGAMVIRTRASADRIALGYLLHLGAAVRRLTRDRRPTFWAVSQGGPNVAVRLYPKGPPRSGERGQVYFEQAGGRNR